MDRDGFLNILKESGVERRYYDLLKNNIENEEKLIREKIRNKFLSNICYEECTILGIDLLGYSKLENERQTMIPFIFDLIYQETISNIVDYESCFFEEYSFRENFISTGDGCYQIFLNPIQALIFNLNFFITLHTYNAYRLYSEFRIFIGELFYRSCITSGKVFSYEKNYYGPALITNARILSRDKLNRFLIDENTYRWFMEKIDGIESISEILLEELLEIFGIYKDWGKTTIFRTRETYKTTDGNKYGREYGKIKSCHVQKIGNISAKDDIISVYNVELQVYVYIFNPQESNIGRGMVVSIGNSNISGIID
jgi:hypothetical protein